MINNSEKIDGKAGKIEIREKKSDKKWKIE